MLYMEGIVVYGVVCCVRRGVFIQVFVVET